MHKKGITIYDKDSGTNWVRRMVQRGTKEGRKNEYVVVIYNRQGKFVDERTTHGRENVRAYRKSVLKGHWKKSVIYNRSREKFANF